jgi:integrase
VTPPRPQKKEIRVLSSGESKRLLQAARGNRFEALYILAITTGMRQGELLGLRWVDADLERGVLRITQTLVTGFGKQMIDTPETLKARRSVVLTPVALESLKRHEKNGSGSLGFTNTTGWYLPTGSGNPYIPRTY